MVIKKVLNKIRSWIKASTYYALWARMNRIERNLKAMQAIDMDWHQRGKIVLLVSVNGQDICKIIDVAKGLTIMEYKELSERLEREYGISPAFFDVAAGAKNMAREVFGYYEKRGDWRDRY